MEQKENYIPIGTLLEQILFFHKMSTALSGAGEGSEGTVMIAFAACLFGLAALASTLTIIATMRRYGAEALSLRSQLAACPGTMTLTWKVIERVPVPALATLRKRPIRRAPARLEWPGAALDLAA